MDTETTLLSLYGLIHLTFAVLMAHYFKKQAGMQRCAFKVAQTRYTLLCVIFALVAGGALLMAYDYLGLGYGHGMVIIFIFMLVPCMTCTIIFFGRMWISWSKIRW